MDIFVHSIYNLRIFVTCSPIERSNVTYVGFAHESCEVINDIVPQYVLTETFGFEVCLSNNCVTSFCTSLACSELICRCSSLSNFSPNDKKTLFKAFTAEPYANKKSVQSKYKMHCLLFFQMTDAYNSSIVYRQALCSFLRGVVTNVLMKVSILKQNLNETDAAGRVFGAN